MWLLKNASFIYIVLYMEFTCSVYTEEGKVGNQVKTGDLILV